VAPSPSPSSPSFQRPRQAGFTYVGLIVLVAIIGLVGAAALKVDALLRRAAAERELLEIGAAFSAALRSYADATPPGQPQQPPTLKELLKDPRFPGTRRHLRKIFVDPVSGRAEWGIVYTGGDTGVLAVYSLSNAKPLKQANFDARFQNLEGKEHLSEWKFGAAGQAVMQPGQGQNGANGANGAPGVPLPGQQPGGPLDANAAANAPASLFPNRTVPGQPAPASPAPPPVPADPPAESPAESSDEPAATPSEASGDGDDTERKGNEEADPPAPVER